MAAFKIALRLNFENWVILMYLRALLGTYAAPFRNLNIMKKVYDWLKLEATMHTAFMNDMTISTFFLPKVSATEPQKYAPAIIPVVQKQNFTLHNLKIKDTKAIKNGRSVVVN